MPAGKKKKIYIYICLLYLVSILLEMDFGEAKFMLSKYLLGQVLLVDSVMQPDSVRYC